MINLLYFAWVRERVGIATETIELPADINTIGDLVEWQRSRGDGYMEAFAEGDLVRAAVNQEHVDLNHTISDGDEIAFFPPVTGG